MSAKAHTLSFTHDLCDDRIVVTAVFIPRTEKWSMLAKVNGEAVGCTMSTDPWTDARAIIEAALADMTKTEVPADTVYVAPERQKLNSTY